MHEVVGRALPPRPPRAVAKACEAPRRADSDSYYVVHVVGRSPPVRHRLDVARAREAPRGYKRSGQRRFLLRCTLCMSSPLSGLYVCCSNVPTVGWLPNTEEILKDSVRLNA